MIRLCTVTRRQVEISDSYPVYIHFYSEDEDDTFFRNFSSHLRDITAQNSTVGSGNVLEKHTCTLFPLVRHELCRNRSDEHVSVISRPEH